MMICRKCGNEIQSGKVKCEVCGYEVTLDEFEPDLSNKSRALFSSENIQSKSSESSANSEIESTDENNIKSDNDEVTKELVGKMFDSMLKEKYESNTVSEDEESLSEDDEIKKDFDKKVWDNLQNDLESINDDKDEEVDNNLEKLFEEVDLSSVSVNDELSEDEINNIISSLNINLDVEEETKEKNKEKDNIEDEKNNSDIKESIKQNQEDDKLLSKNVNKKTIHISDKKLKKGKVTKREKHDIDDYELDEEALAEMDNILMNNLEEDNDIHKDKVEIKIDSAKKDMEKEDEFVNTIITDDNSSKTLTEDNNLENIDKDEISDKKENDKKEKIDKKDDKDIASEDGNDSTEKHGLANIIKKIFGNIQDDEYAEKLEQTEADERRKKREKLNELQEKKEQKNADKEQKKADKDIAKENKKKTKEALVKKKKAQKEAKRKKKQEEISKEEKTRINKLGAFIVLIFFAIIVVLVITYINKYTIEHPLNEAVKLYNDGKYDEAYDILAGCELKDDKYIILYNKLRILKTLNKQLSYCDSYIIIEKYPEAFDSLIKAVTIYDDNKDNAKEYGLDLKYDEIFEQVSERLQNTFGVSVKEARVYANIVDRTEYTQKVNEICDNIKSAE